MNNTLIKLTAITALAATAMFGLSACSSSADAGSTSGDSPSTQVVGPVAVDVATLDGTTVEVNVDQLVYIQVGTTTDPANFVGKVADGTVAEFTAGGTVGSSTYNPGVTGLTKGTTAVELTHSKTGDVINFTVIVK